jgi:hypothetical protein
VIEFRALRVVRSQWGRCDERVAAACISESGASLARITLHTARTKIFHLSLMA